MTIVNKVNYCVAWQGYIPPFEEGNLSSSLYWEWLTPSSTGQSYYAAATIPVESIEVPNPNADVNYFRQGGIIFRNEKAVYHTKSQSTLYPKLPGDRIILPDNYHWGDEIVSGQYHHTNYYCFRKIDVADTIQGVNFERGSGSVMFYLEQHWLNGVPDKSGLRIRTPHGYVFDTFPGEEPQWRSLDIHVTFPKGRVCNTPSDVIAAAQEISVLAVRRYESGIRRPRYWVRTTEPSHLEEAFGFERNAVRTLAEPTLLVGDWKDESKTLTSDRYKARGKIVGKIAEQVGRLTSNNASLALEMCNIIRGVIGAIRGKPTEISRIFTEIRQVKSLKQATKLAADLRLSEQYGIKLTVRDILELSQYMNRDLSHSIARAACSYRIPTQYGTILMDEHWKVFYDPNPSDAGVINLALRSDFIGLQNIWDFIPYSFVVDWFVPVGDILQGWDDELMLSTLPIDVIIVGSKAHGVFVKNTSDGTLEVIASSYDRSSVTSFPPYATATHHNITGNTVVNGAALIVQHL